MSKRDRNLKWDKLDNTANLFPVIAHEGMSNVYRISVVLKEDVKGDLLQSAVEKVLPFFDTFKCSMKKGIFWYYFEENKGRMPKVKEEYTYPCMFINPHNNKNFLFRVSYYKKRINLEVFHALTDGNGAVNFLKEITYAYIRLAHPELTGVSEGLAEETSLDTSDSYVNNYKKAQKRTYKTKRAVIVKGDKLPINQFAVIHGIMPIQDIKTAAKKYGMTINAYIVAAYTWAIYKSYLHGTASKKPITIAVPVNLRPYFGSDTNKNFFVVVSSEFLPKREEEYSFDEIAEIVKESLSKQINKENLEKLFSYNVSNEKNLMLRSIPLFIKQFAIRYVYNDSAKANTSTVTNLGIIKTSEPYSDYIDRFQAILSMSKGQNMKITVFSYKEDLVLTFSANIRENEIQKTFFRKLASDGIKISVETNGVYYE